MNIVLIGYRGTGKSVVADILANKLGMKSYSVDQEIVREAGMPIPQIVEKYGWPGFRDLETKIVKQLSGLDKIIIDTGGGVIERPDNIQALRENGRIFWLRASVDVIISRISDGTERPALTSGKSFTEEVSEVLEQRIPKYKSAAHSEIDTDNIRPDQVALELIESWST